MTKKLRALAAVLCAAVLTFSAAACGSAPAENEPTPTATPTAAPETTPTPETTAPPSAEPSAAPTETPDETEESVIPVEVQAMYPLIEAHMLAQLNGGAFSADDPAYFWQTVCFAIDGCGLEFYSAETVGNALVLSRGVIEEIASGLFEGGGDALPDIPESLGGELQYDAESDAYAHPLGGGGYALSVRGMIDSDDGPLMLMVSLTAGDTVVADFTAELVENTRAGNSLFTYSIRSVKRQ
ncbi:MAG: hypothetical protein ACI4GO_10055 [Hominenteromicrobium sp.]